MKSLKKFSKKEVRNAKMVKGGATRNNTNPLLDDGMDPKDFDKLIAD